MLHMLQIFFVGKSCAYIECQSDCLGPQRQVIELLLEDPMRQARNQDTLLHGIPSSNRRPNGGHQPHTLRSTSRDHQEEYQGVGGVSTYCRVCLQPSKTLDYRQVPFEVVYGFNLLSPLDILPLPLQERINMDASARVTYLKKMHEDTRKTIERQVQ